MKTTLKKMSLAILLVLGLTMGAQTGKPVLAVLNIDSKGLNIDAVSLTNLTRTEVEKLDTFSVIDKYELQQFMQHNNVNLSNCYGKSCLTEVGLQLKCDKMFTGSVELIGKNIVVTFRLFNVAQGQVEKTYVGEFLNIPEEIQNMVKLSVNDMLDRFYDKNMMNKLSKRNTFDNSINNPSIDRLALDGPRMGFITYSGELNSIVSGPKSNGGFDLFPAMFQFGYQFEKQYLNEGKVQALFEFIPMITGLDQGYCLPSLTLLHGVRSNINGWEIGFGPSFNILRIAKGYYDDAGQWQLSRTWHADGANSGIENPHEIKERMDSRGDFRLESYFVLAAGRTFKSGRLNIPMNIFVIPGRYGWKFGFSFGFNGKNKS